MARSTDEQPHTIMSTHSTTASTFISRRFSVAPMMDYTDRYCRYFHRLLSKETLLYTEMVTTGALIHGDQYRHLHYHESEHRDYSIFNNDHWVCERQFR